MAQAATQSTAVQTTPPPAAIAGPATSTTTTALPNRERALQILSKSIYRELRENGYEPKQIVALASEIISLVTTDIGDPSIT